MINSLPSSTLVPHGYCLSGQPGLIAALVIGNLLIALAYFAIPLVILRFIRQRQDIDFRYLHWLFAGFIVTCGITHLLHVVGLWYPVYYLEALMGLLTGGVSIMAAVMLWKLLPVFVRLPSSNQLRAANDELKKVSEELQDRETQLRSLGDSLPDSYLYQYTLEGEKPKFLYVSSGVERVSGIKAESAMQDAMLLLGQIEARQREAYAVAQAASQRDLSDFSMDLHLLRADGTWRWMQVKSRPRRKNDGQVIWDGIATDITDRHLFETEINRLAQAIEQNPTGILITDPQGTLEYMNEACTRISGYRFADAYASSRTPREIISTELSDAEYGAVQKQLLSGKTWNGVIRNRHKNGKMYWEQITVSPIYDSEGKVASYLYLRSDVTEQKNAEAELRELKDDLEIRVAKRTAQLEAANQELEAFSYTVSHDLRAPLRAIDGFSSILLDDYADKLDDDGKRLLKVVRDNTTRMGQLIDDILRFSRTSRLEINYSEIDMAGLAHAVVAELQPAIDGSKLQVEVDAIPPATGDRAMLHQVFVNLLSNAIKFSSFRETASIRVGGFVEGEQNIYYVRDNGVGFDMQYADKLFGVFQRLHAANEFEGTGIGLAIVKRIVTRHGGRVWAEGKINEGATIYFSIPAQTLTGRDAS